MENGTYSIVILIIYYFYSNIKSNRKEEISAFLLTNSRKLGFLKLTKKIKLIINDNFYLNYYNILSCLSQGGEIIKSEW